MEETAGGQGTKCRGERCMMSEEKQCFDGEIFSEIVEIEGKKYEHIGFRDEEGAFGRFLEENVGKRVKVCFIVEEEQV